MKHSLKNILPFAAFMAFIGFEPTAPAQGTGTYVTVIPGPVSPILAPNSNGTYSGTGWFPDSSFPVVWGGPNNPDTNLSWWIPLHVGKTLDTAVTDPRLPPGGGWVNSGAKYSGDSRGFWLITAYRPTDYGQSGTANLFLYNDDNSSLTPGAPLAGAQNPIYGTNPGTVPSTTSAPESAGPGTPVSVTIDPNYLVGFAHVEDYNPKNGDVLNFYRTIYSFNNGLHWTKGPWTGYGQGGAVDNRTAPGTPHLITVGLNQLGTTSDVITGATGESTTAITAPQGGDSNFAYPHCLFFNRYLQQWVSFYGNWSSITSQSQIMASGDLNTFYKGEPFSSIYATPGGVTRSPGSYFTVMGGFPAGTIANSFGMECGQLAWLYNNSGGLVGQAISFIKVPQQDITWNGTGNPNLGIPGNWAVTGTPGIFGGFADEQNSLTFGGSGGTVIDNIPSTIRVRGITYSTGAGSYTITGTNHLAMEAYTTSHPTGVYGITNHSLNPETINSPIDVRTAALYLLTDAGPLTLNGGIDLMGSGGMVISGTGATTINGAIVDSGYRDFTTGTAESIEGANIGWVVKQNSGTLMLGGQNTYPGRTDILGGVVQLAKGSNLVNSVVSLKTGTANSLVLNGDTALGGLNGTDNLSIGSYNLTIGNSNAAQPNYPVNYTGTISGSGSLTKTGTSTQTFGGTNTYTGGTHLQGGTLQVPGNLAFGPGPLTFGGGSLKPMGNLAVNNAIVLASGVNSIDTNGQNVTLNSSITGTGSLVCSGSGTLVLAGTVDNTFSGGLTVDNILQISRNGALGTGEFELNGGTLQLGASIDLGSEGIHISGTGSNIDTQDFNVSSEGTIDSAAGDTLTKIGSGSFTWSGNGAGFKGDLIVAGGVFNDAPSGPSSIFSQGNITLAGSTLAIRPSGSGAAVSSSFVPPQGTAFTVNGSAILSLDQGKNTSLTVQIGSPGNPGALHLGSSALLISTAGGSSTLGHPAGVNLLVAGLPATGAGQIYSPSVVAAGPINLATDPHLEGDFVTYNPATGFSNFTGYTNRNGSFSTTSTGEVTNISNASALNADSNAQALRLTGMGSLDLAGHTFMLNGTGTSGQAGVLLNGGTIGGAGTLAFGPNHGMIYVGGTTASISSTITGTGGITFSGAPATLDLPATATAAYVPAVPFAQVALTGTGGFSGGLTIEGASVSCDPMGLGAGIDPVTLDGQGTLITTASTTSLPQTVHVNGGGGAIEIDGGPSHVVNLTGTLAGTGALRKTGTGALGISGTGAFTGSLYVDAGHIDFTSSSAMTNDTSMIGVGNGASITLETDHTVTHNIAISGAGEAGQPLIGALQVQGGGNLTGTVTLTGDAMIGNTGNKPFIFNNTISGQNHSLIANSQNSNLLLRCNVLLGSGGITLAGSHGLTIGVKGNAVYTGATSIPAATLLTLNGTINGTSGVALDGAMNGIGTITTPGTVNVTGQFIPGATSRGMATGGGLFTINGNLALNGTMETYLGNAQGISATAGSSSSYGTVLVNGTATVGGTLSIYYRDSYKPAVHDTIWLMLRNGGDGNFSSINVYPAGSTIASWSSSGTVEEGDSITVNGRSGKIHYASHNGLDLTTGHDICIQF